MSKRVDIKTGFLCNNNCLFCVQADNKLQGNRSYDEIKKDLIESKQRCEGVVLTGGEVTIRKDFFEIVNLCKNLGYKNIQIQSNGRMFSSLEFCKKTIEAGATEFALAIHGYCEEQHDHLTMAPRSFKQVIKGIKNLKFLDANIITNTVVVKQNYKDLEKIAKLLVTLNLNQFQFAFVHAMGKAKENFEIVVPNKTDASKYIKKAINLGLKSGKFVTVEAIPYCLMRGYETHIAENYIPKTEIKGKEFQNIRDFDNRRKHFGKIKFEKCNLCEKNTICEGPWREYPEIYGDKEFNPIIK